MIIDATKTSTHRSSVKVIGVNGQISLGKEYASRQVLVEEQEPGVWLIRTVKVIPDNEIWLHVPQTSQDLEQAMQWADQHPAIESDPLEIIKKLENAQESK